MNKTQFIRDKLNKQKGNTVHITAIGSRNKKTSARGILDGVYSEVFTVLVDEGDYTRRYSYTYNEVLTNNVKIVTVS